MAKTDEKKLARALYLNTQHTAKEIADMVKVSEKTLGKWKEDENWDKLKAAKSATRDDIIAMNYILLRDVTEHNQMLQKNRELSSKDIDMQHKISSTIKNLEGEESLSDYIQAFTPFLEWMKEEDNKLAIKFAELSQKFLLMKTTELK